MTIGESGIERDRGLLMVERLQRGGRTKDAIDATYVKVNHGDDADSLGVFYEIAQTWSTRSKSHMKLYQPHGGISM